METLTKSFSPPSHDAQSKALSGLLVELHSKRVPQVVLLVLGLVPVDHQADPLRCLSQHVDGLIVTGLAKVDAIHLWPRTEIIRLMGFYINNNQDPSPPTKIFMFK